MSKNSFVISLPIGDRRTSAAFYTRFLDREPFGAPADDGVPEPLQFGLDGDVSLMLIPSGGFGWVIGSTRRVAEPPVAECLLSLRVDTESAVGERTATARDAGAEVVSEPAHKDWGYVCVVADPDGHLWQVIHAG
ncbi:MAG: VOC family protein [Actinomycetota bacterium]|nr:VOC family protein [Actinomycetota bacterium]